MNDEPRLPASAAEAPSLQNKTDQIEVELTEEKASQQSEEEEDQLIATSDEESEGNLEPTQDGILITRIIFLVLSAAAVLIAFIFMVMTLAAAFRRMKWQAAERSRLFGMSAIVIWTMTALLSAAQGSIEKNKKLFSRVSIYALIMELHFTLVFLLSAIYLLVLSGRDFYQTIDVSLFYVISFVAQMALTAFTGYTLVTRTSFKIRASPLQLVVGGVVISFNLL